MMKVELKKAKGYYDLSLRVNIFYPGDVIYLLNKATKKGRAKKLEHIWQSPAVITHMITPFLFRIRFENRTEREVNHDTVKLCTDVSLNSRRK